MNQKATRLTINIGGTIFITSIDTLKNNPRAGNDNYFIKLLSKSWKDTLDDRLGNECFIDRDPKSFKIILNYLRGYDLDLEKLSDIQRNMIYLDSIFYGFDSIIQLFKEYEEELNR